MKDTNFAPWSEQNRDFVIGKTVYYIPTFDVPCVSRGKVIDVYRDGSISLVTIQNKNGDTVTDSSNHFCNSFPTILNYWKN